MTDEEPSLNISSLLTLAVVSFFVIRWFFKRDGDAGEGTGRSRARGNVIDPAQVEQLSQMFPQLSTRDIIWDLQRNGGNVAATTERILNGRGLETPPPSFQPQINIPRASMPAAQTAATTAASKADGQDLISRYNLATKIAAENNEATQTSASGWSQNKEERQRLLQKRRDDMILAARKRMEQKVRETAL